eukprot:158282-Amphidinium_carterae.1
MVLTPLAIWNGIPYRADVQDKPDVWNSSGCIVYTQYVALKREQDLLVKILVLIGTRNETDMSGQEGG